MSQIQIFTYALYGHTHTHIHTPLHSHAHRNRIALSPLIKKSALSVLCSQKYTFYTHLHVCMHVVFETELKETIVFLVTTFTL